MPSYSVVFTPGVGYTIGPIPATGGAGSLPEVTLGAGPTAITHTDHSNRAVRSEQAGATSVVFAAAATSGAVASDLVTILNVGAGLMTASGQVTAAPGMKLTAAENETLYFWYDADDDMYYGGSLIVVAPGGAVAWDRREKTFWVPNQWQAGSAQTALGLNNPATLDSSSVSATSPDYSNLYKSIPASRITGAAAAVSRLAGLTGGKFCYYRTDTPTGFKQRVSVIGGVADAIASGQFGMGIYFNAPAWTASGGTNVQPSAMILSCFLGADEGDSQMTIMSSDGTGPCAKTALNGGTGFPANSNGVDMYEVQFTLNIIAGVASVGYTAKNLITGITASGTLTTQADLPINSIAQLGWFICRGSANTATAPVCDFGGARGGSMVDF